MKTSFHNISGPYTSKIKDISPPNCVLTVSSRFPQKFVFHTIKKMANQIALRVLVSNGLWRNVNFIPKWKGCKHAMK